MLGSILRTLMMGRARLRRRLTLRRATDYDADPRLGRGDRSACAPCIPSLIDLSTGRVERLLAALGRPQDGLAPVIHVAGTNGKGSTVAYPARHRRGGGAEGARADLAAPGALRRAHPHRRPADHRRRRCRDLIDEVEAANAGEPISFFEITTALAFHAFAQDAGRPLPSSRWAWAAASTPPTCSTRPAVSVITPVDYDHLEMLGPELAQDRLGEGRDHQARPAGGRRPPAGRGAGGHRGRGARALGAPLTLMGRDFDAWEERGRLVVQTRGPAARPAAAQPVRRAPVRQRRPGGRRHPGARRSAHRRGGDRPRRRRGASGRAASSA